MKMTGFIPFSGLIIGILSIAAFLKVFGLPLMWLVIAAMGLSYGASDNLHALVTKQGVHGVSRGPVVVAALYQDILCAVSLYVLLR